MRINIVLTAFACATAMLVITPKPASSLPLNGVGSASNVQVDNGLVEQVHRRWRGYRGYYRGYYHPRACLSP